MDDPTAQHVAGELSDDVAVKWYAKAARRGYAQAQFKLRRDVRPRGARGAERQEDAPMEGPGSLERLSRSSAAISAS